MIATAANEAVPTLLGIALLTMAGVVIIPMLLLLIGEALTGWWGTLGEWLIPTTLVLFLFSIVFVIIAAAVS